MVVALPPTRALLGTSPPAMAAASPAPQAATRQTRGRGPCACHAPPAGSLFRQAARSAPPAPTARAASAACHARHALLACSGALDVEPGCDVHTLTTPALAVFPCGASQAAAPCPARRCASCRRQSWRCWPASWTNRWPCNLTSWHNTLQLSRTSPAAWRRTSSTACLACTPRRSTHLGGGWATACTATAALMPACLACRASLRRRLLCHSRPLRLAFRGRHCQ